MKNIKSLIIPGTMLLFLSSCKEPVSFEKYKRLTNAHCECLDQQMSTDGFLTACPQEEAAVDAEEDRLWDIILEERQSDHDYSLELERELGILHEKYDMCRLEAASNTAERENELIDLLMESDEPADSVSLETLPEDE